MTDSIDQRLAFVADDGRVAYPYKKNQRKTGRYGFALTRPGDLDRNGGGEYTLDIEEVVRRVVVHGWSVRVKGIGDGSSKGDTIGLGKRSFHHYWVAPELRHLVRHARLQPLDTVPVRRESHEREEPHSGLEAVNRVSAADFAKTLRAVELRMSPAQRAMLVGHANAKHRLASMQRIAEFGGYAAYGTANSQYGKLGGLVAAELGISDLGNKTQALAEGGQEADERGHWQWRLREPLALAMEQLGWIEPYEGESLARSVAEAELDADPASAGLPETTRRALVNARIGQGGFRRRMLALWDFRCPVTGCDIQDVLIASHAKSWQESTNAERLDEYNGLPLAASVDRLFDRGIIAFGSDGQILVKPEISDHALGSVGLSRSSCLIQVYRRSLPYLKAHRERFGFGA
jgi:hypothetical protein